MNACQRLERTSLLDLSTHELRSATSLKEKQ